MSFGSPARAAVLNLLDVPALEASVWRELDLACWLPVDHDPAPPMVPLVPGGDGGDPGRDVALGCEKLAGIDRPVRPHGIDTALFSRVRARGRAWGCRESAFIVGAVAMNKGVPSRKSLRRSWRRSPPSGRAI